MFDLRSGFLALLAVSACAVPPSQDGVAEEPQPVDRGDFGVLLMAHGGSDEWNQGVLDAVQPLRKRYPMEVAFGMADAVSIQEAVQALEGRGIRSIAVVRLFVSGESWYEQTEQILGLRSGAPMLPASGSTIHEAAHGGHSMGFWKIRTDSSFALSKEGLSEAEGMGEVLADRARVLSQDPRQEDVLILAHGPGDDRENERWIANIRARAATIRTHAPFRRVEVETLREDWPEKRELAEHRIREFVERARIEGGTAIVIPFRVQGFGPYARVLDGLDYVSDGQGLIPHDNVTLWIAKQIEGLRRGPFDPALVDGAVRTELLITRSPSAPSRIQAEGYRTRR